MDKFITEGHCFSECRDPLTIASVGLSVVGGMMEQRAIASQTAAQTAALQAQANAARYNAELNQQNAQIARGQTEAEMDKADRERRLRMGTMRAGAGASGVGSESFGDLLMSSAMQEELDLLTIQSEGMLRERNYLAGAQLDTMQSQSYSSQIPLVKSAGKAKSAASLLSGVSSGIGGMNFGGSPSGAKPFGPYKDRRYFV